MARAQNPAAEFQTVLARAAAEEARNKPQRVNYVARPGEPAAAEPEPLVRRVAPAARAASPERVAIQNLPRRAGSGPIPIGAGPKEQIVRRVGKPQN